MAVDKAVLFKARLPEDTVDVDGIGPVRVRGLSRIDLLTIHRADTSEPGSFERLLLARAMVDPELTEEEVGRWQEASSPHEIEAVASVVTRLSALQPDAAKEVYREFDADPDAEFRDVPGEGAGDDSGPAAGGDAER